MKIEIPTGDWYCPECLEKRVRRGDAVVVSKRSGEEQVELSRDYVGNLIKSEEKKAQKRKLKKGREEEEEEDNDEGRRRRGGVSTRRQPISGSQRFLNFTWVFNRNPFNY